MIKVENLSKSYGKIKAIDDISFEIEKGQVVGFLGPNGAGKSTTLKILTGYIPPNAGKVEIGGIDVLTNSIEARKKTGYLPETTPLYKNMKVIEYLKFVAEIRDIKRSEWNDRFEYVLERLGLKSAAYKSIRTLSKGFKQRVGIAQALIHKPEILILDEPTSGLDPNQVFEIRELIKSLEKNHTIILSTHILQEVEAICDTIIIINKGKIVAKGSRDELSSDSKILTDIVLRGDRTKTLNLLQSRGISFKETSSPDGISLEIESGSDIREDLFNIAKENNLVLMEMKKRNLNLEEIFKKLTTNQP